MLNKKFEFYKSVMCRVHGTDEVVSENKELRVRKIKKTIKKGTK